MTRVLLADDHPMIGAALEVLLRGTDYELIGRARSGADALAQIQRLKPDLLLLDVHMPDGSGLDVLRKLRENRRAPAVVLLTAGMDDSQLLAVDKLAAEGMVLKTSDPALLIECMEKVRKGERCVDPEIAERMSHAKERASRAPSLTPRKASATATSAPSSESPKARSRSICTRSSTSSVSTTAPSSRCAPATCSAKPSLVRADAGRAPAPIRRTDCLR